jgi:magnesium chelatase family protein
MNPCPCGYFRHPDRKCSCTPQAIRSYMSRISRPLLDRIDLHIGVKPVNLQCAQIAESSAVIRKRVIAARNIQLERAAVCNALMTTAMVKQFCILGKTEQEVLNQAMVQHKLSARSYDRILKVARTIADLADNRKISLPDLAEAIGYRQLDKDYLSR